MKKNNEYNETLNDNYMETFEYMETYEYQLDCQIENEQVQYEVLSQYNQLADYVNEW